MVEHDQTEIIGLKIPIAKDRHVRKPTEDFDQNKINRMWSSKAAPALRNFSEVRVSEREFQAASDRYRWG
jgi:hypothetical protein